MATAPAATITLFRVAAVLVAPAVLLGGSLHHPWIGSPGDPGFFARLGAAVAADPTRWAVAHLVIAGGSGLLVLAFLAVRSWLWRRGKTRWVSDRLRRHELAARSRPLCASDRDPKGGDPPAVWRGSVRAGTVVSCLRE